MNSTGANTAKAVRVLNQAGVTAAALAADLQVSPSTVYRWRNGGRPNQRNYTALRHLVDHLLAQATAGQSIASQAQTGLLQAAKDALLTPAEVAELDQLAARLRDSWAARRQPQPQPVGVRELVTQQRRQRDRQIAEATAGADAIRATRSAYAGVDPFELCRDDRRELTGVMWS